MEQNDIEVSNTCEAFYGDITYQVASWEVQPFWGIESFLQMFTQSNLFKLLVKFSKHNDMYATYS